MEEKEVFESETFDHGYEHGYEEEKSGYQDGKMGYQAGCHKKYCGCDIGCHKPIKPSIKICKIANRRCVRPCGIVWFRIIVQNYGCKAQRVCVVDRLDKCLQYVCGSLTVCGRRFKGNIEKGVLLCLRPCETQIIQFAVRVKPCCCACGIGNVAEARIEIPCDKCYRIFSNKVCLCLC